METVVEFKIDDMLCRIVAEQTVDADTPEQMVSGSDGPDGLQIVGACAVLGRRYLILSAAPSADSKSNALPCVRDLLTPRELQVAEQVACGHVNKQIATRLRISEYTVASYLRRVFVKLGVRTRAAMVARMMAEGCPKLQVGEQSNVGSVNDLEVRATAAPHDEERRAR